MKLSNKILISDPCYNLGTWCTYTTDIKPGNYNYNVEYEDGRVASIELYHEDYEYLDYEPAFDDIGVDSGQCGIFDYNVVKDIIGTGKYNDKESFYGSMCFFTDNDDRYTALSYGIVCQSGYGDGTYCVDIAKDKEEIVGIKVVFIDNESWNEDDEEVEEEYYEEEEE